MGQFTLIINQIIQFNLIVMNYQELMIQHPQDLYCRIFYNNLNLFVAVFKSMPLM